MKIPKKHDMKQKAILLSVILISTIIYSCQKDNDPATPTPVTTYPGYSCLKSGNYWIYEQYDIDSLGNAISNNKYDSCYIEKDTIINNKTYLKMIRPKPYQPGQQDISFLKDSLHYIVNASGKILFSSQDFSSGFESVHIMAGAGDTICLMTRKMADKDLSVTTPAGTFTTSDARETYSMYPNWSTAGNIRIIHKRYAENIGIVTETLPFFVASPKYIERRLVRYHLN